MLICLALQSLVDEPIRYCAPISSEESDTDTDNAEKENDVANRGKKDKVF